MKKKSVLIVSGGMEIGGIERSLLGLLNAMDYERYEVDLQLFSVGGELLKFIDSRCNILPEIRVCATMVQPIASVLKTHPVLGIKRAVTKIMTERKYGTDDAATFALLAEYWHRCVGSMPKIQKHYDTAISFMWPHDFAAKNVNADRKIAWIHTDYTRANMNFQQDETVWNCFDKIAGVSDEVCSTFASVYPNLAEKLITIENILPEKLVRAQAEEFVPNDMDTSEKTVLSVGRVCHAKGFELAAQSAKIMRDNGVKFKWYILGYGPDEALLKSEIERLQVGDCFVFLGKKANPYPYMNACTVYAQPSRYEGKAVTVREAQMLGKPVLITDYETAPSQVENGVDGVICPMGVESVAQALTDLLADESTQAKLIQNCGERDYSNRSFMQVVYSLL
ncbi:MAG TPA: glycosyl transferase [Ruminococcaceae bacterium]|nr:glycosyl transferase [Oscillospiraceae bacterium]